MFVPRRVLKALVKATDRRSSSRYALHGVHVSRVGTVGSAEATDGTIAVVVKWEELSVEVRPEKEWLIGTNPRTIFGNGIAETVAQQQPEWEGLILDASDASMVAALAAASAERRKFTRSLDSVFVEEPAKTKDGRLYINGTTTCRVGDGVRKVAVEVQAVDGRFPNISGVIPGYTEETAYRFLIEPSLLARAANIAEALIGKGRPMTFTVSKNQDSQLMLTGESNDGLAVTIIFMPLSERNERGNP
jgi:hypothetical protein